MIDPLEDLTAFEVLFCNPLLNASSNYFLKLRIMAEKKVDPQSPIPSDTKRSVKGHVCRICLKWFKRSGDLRRHGSVHSTEKPIPCDHCSMKFASKERLRSHHKYIALKKAFPCEVCSKSFKMINYLKLHMFTHSKEKPYKCEMCNKDFRRKSGLEYHYGSQKYLAHHKKFEEFNQFEYLIEKFKPKNDGVHVCAVCNKEFKTAKYLENHSISHSQRTHECDMCGLLFKNKDYIRRHKRAIHSMRRELYPCEICKKTFTTKYSVKLHKIAVHEERKPFECEVCHRSFPKKCMLAMHMSAHNGVRKYACIMCDKKYRALSGLKYHMRNHTGEKPYMCEICNTCFKSNDILKTHYKKCKKIETNLKTTQSIDTKIGILPLRNENSKIDLVKLPAKNIAVESLGQATCKSLQAAKKAFTERNEILTSKNIKFIKVQSAAELNFLRVTRLFQRYRSLSNVYSK